MPHSQEALAGLGWSELGPSPGSVFNCNTWVTDSVSEPWTNDLSKGKGIPSFSYNFKWNDGNWNTSSKSWIYEPDKNITELKGKGDPQNAGLRFSPNGLDRAAKHKWALRTDQYLDKADTGKITQHFLKPRANLKYPNKSHTEFMGHILRDLLLRRMSFSKEV